MEEEIKLQEETVTITEPVTNPDTGEFLDETQVEIKPEVVAPEPIITTLGDLKIKLQEAIDAKNSHDLSYQDSTKFFDKQITDIQAQIEQVK
jgi:hypothetical protein